MPEQFTVPQFIDAEDKILGPITIRQFVILLIAFVVDGILFRLLPFIWFILIAIPVIVFAGVVAFVKINGMPFHYFILNLVQTARRPKLRVWDKKLETVELKAKLTKKEAPPPPPARKAPVSTSRLQELTLVVNTGGLYKPEGEE